MGRLVTFGKGFLLSFHNERRCSGMHSFPTEYVYTNTNANIACSTPLVLQ